MVIPIINEQAWMPLHKISMVKIVFNFDIIDA